MEKKEYIERVAILRKSEPMFDGQKYCTAVNTGFIYTAPAADVVEVVHGHWYVSEYEYLNCSACGGAMYTGCNSTKEAELLKHHWKPYCPNCGAKMDGGKE